MAKKTIDSTAVRKISAELDCDPETVRKVFREKKPTNRPVSKKIFELLKRDGYLDGEESGEAAS